MTTIFPPGIISNCRDNLETVKLATLPWQQGEVCLSSGVQ